jgi:hypothetical protein
LEKTAIFLVTAMGIKNSSELVSFLPLATLLREKNAVVTIGQETKWTRKAVSTVPGFEFGIPDRSVPGIITMPAELS